MLSSSSQQLCLNEPMCMDKLLVIKRTAFNFCSVSGDMPKPDGTSSEEGDASCSSAMAPRQQLRAQASTNNYCLDGRSGGLVEPGSIGGVRTIRTHAFVAVFHKAGGGTDDPKSPNQHILMTTKCAIHAARCVPCPVRKVAWRPAHFPHGRTRSLAQSHTQRLAGF